MTMKGRVITLLNIRTGSPSIRPDNNPGYYKPGEVLEIVETVTGDEYKGNNIWFKTPDGSFVWSGGVKLSGDALHAVSAPLTQAPFDLSAVVRLNAGTTLPTGGKEGVVAILDSGITHSLLKDRILAEKNFVGSGSPQDLQGHGTRIAGIVAGNGPVIKGLAYASSLINYRVADHNGVVTADPVYYALKALQGLSQVPDVINMSLTVSADIIPFLQPMVDDLVTKGSVVVIAAGNHNRINAIAALKNTIRVGAFRTEDFQDLKKQGLNSVYHCCFADIPILSTALNDQYGQIGEASAYTAVISSLVCAFLKDPANQNLAPQKRLETTLNFLSQAAFPITQENNPEPFKPFKP